MILTEEIRTAMLVARNYKRMQDASRDAGNALQTVMNINTSDHFIDAEQREILMKAQAIVSTLQERTSEYNAEQYLKNIQS